MPLYFGIWDLILIVVVSVQATILAYMPSPRWKALILSLPIPFTVASMAVGVAIGPTNVTGLVVLFIFFQGVRILHLRLRISIVPSIALALSGYCLLGWGLARILPATEEAFWWASAVTFLLALTLYLTLPYRVESTQPTPLPVWQKLPLVMAVVCFLILIKGLLQGFATVFPMIGVIAVYEARHCLWTMGRQVPVIMLNMLPMMVTAFIAQEYIGLGPALALSWVVCLGVLTTLMRSRWVAERTAVRED